MKMPCIVVLTLLVPATTFGQPVDTSTENLARVVLIGDSIRLSYAPVVLKQLEGRAAVVSPKANGGDSSNVLKHLEAWVIREQPDVVHFNCGIHDIKRFRATGEFQVSPEQYEANLRAIVNRIRTETGAVVLFAMTTPILDDRAAKTRSNRDYELLGASIERYNAIATKVMQELQVPVNNLYAALNSAGTSSTAEALIAPDGVHLTTPATELLGKKVAAFIRQHLQASELAQLWQLSKLQEAPALTWIDKTSPIRSLTYRNELFQGQETDVFAFYATPGSLAGDESDDREYPAVVLIHGGGGTAFAEWVWLWAKRGYAAIAMDLSGRRPSAPQFDEQSGQLILNRRAPRTRLERGGPEADHVAKFNNVGGDITDDWQYHAVAAAIRAHSLVRSFREVDGERTAVTGISWGGYLTCLVASIDSRFKAAVPVYGCGFLYEGDSVQKRLIDELSPEKRAEWIRIYEPSAWLPKCEVPIFFVNGTNDKHYPLMSYARSYDLVPGRKQIRIEVSMRHSHIHGWAPVEIGMFIDQYLMEGAPLPVIAKPRVDGNQSTAIVTSGLPISRADLHYTTDSGSLVSRRWQSREASLEGKAISAVIPDDATIWMLSVTDSRGAMVSTEVIFRVKE